MLDMMSWTVDLLQGIMHQAAVFGEAALKPVIPEIGPSDQKAPWALERLGKKVLGALKFGGVFVWIAGYGIIGIRMILDHKRGMASSHVYSIVIATSGGVILVFAEDIIYYFA